MLPAACGSPCCSSTAATARGASGNRLVSAAAAGAADAGVVDCVCAATGAGIPQSKTAKPTHAALWAPNAPVPSALRRVHPRQCFPASFTPNILSCPPIVSKI
jgi:hypothetical protein